MNESIAKKITPNILKGAAAAVAIGSVAVPALDPDAVSPHILRVKDKKPDTEVRPLGDSPVYTDGASVTVADAEFKPIVHFKPKNKPKHKPVIFTALKPVEGAVSTFGWPLDGSSGGTADGGNTERPCIAIRNDSTLDHKFQVTVFVSHVMHQANMIQCDWGPAAWTGRAIDITGLGARELNLDPYNFPTGALGIARELK